MKNSPKYEGSGLKAIDMRRLFGVFFFLITADLVLAQSAWVDREKVTWGEMHKGLQAGCIVDYAAGETDPSVHFYVSSTNRLSICRTPEYEWIQIEMDEGTARNVSLTEEGKKYSKSPLKPAKNPSFLKRTAVGLSSPDSARRVGYIRCRDVFRAKTEGRYAISFKVRVYVRENQSGDILPVHLPPVRPTIRLQEQSNQERK